jgi:hypothetical protein
MADKMSVLLINPDGSESQEIGTLMEVTESKKPWTEYTLEKIIPVFSKAIRNMMNMRDHLLLQLNLEYGFINEEYFNKEEPKCLFEMEKIPIDKLKEEIKLLYSFTGYPFDSMDISDILNCSVGDAEIVIGQYINEV